MNSPAPSDDPSNISSNDDLADFFESTSAGGDERDLDDAAHQIGARIAEARQAAEMSRVRLAEHLGVTESTIDSWESGTTLPRSNRLAMVAGVLGVSLSWLMIGRGVEPTDRTAEVSQLRRSVEAMRGRLSDTVADLEQLEMRLGSLDT